MKQTSTLLLVGISLGFVTLLYGQPKSYNIVNGFGVQGGITKFDIITDNFVTQSNTGWMGGMSATVDIPNRWYNVSYSIQFSENNLDIFGHQSATAMNDAPIEFKLFTAQIALLAHVKLIGSNVTLDAGPMLQYNSELELNDENQSQYILANYDNLTADEITGISKFNADGIIGLTAGYDSFKIRAQYIYGFTNILNKLNNKELDTSGSSETKFKGNLTMLAFTAMFTF